MSARRGKPGRFGACDIQTLRKQYDDIMATPTIRDAARAAGVSDGMFRQIGERIAYKWVPEISPRFLAAQRARSVKDTRQIPLFSMQDHS